MNAIVSWVANSVFPSQVRAEGLPKKVEEKSSTKVNIEKQTKDSVTIHNKKTSLLVDEGALVVGIQHGAAAALLGILSVPMLMNPAALPAGVLFLACGACCGGSSIANILIAFGMPRAMTTAMSKMDSKAEKLLARFFESSLEKKETLRDLSAKIMIRDHFSRESIKLATALIALEKIGSPASHVK